MDYIWVRRIRCSGYNALGFRKSDFGILFPSSFFKLYHSTQGRRRHGRFFFCRHCFVPAGKQCWCHLDFPVEQIMKNKQISQCQKSGFSVNRIGTFRIFRSVWLICSVYRQPLCYVCCSIMMHRMLNFFWGCNTRNIQNGTNWLMAKTIKTKTDLRMKWLVRNKKSSFRYLVCELFKMLQMSSLINFRSI